MFLKVRSFHLTIALGTWINSYLLCELRLLSGEQQELTVFQLESRGFQVFLFIIEVGLCQRMIFQPAVGKFQTN